MSNEIILQSISKADLEMMIKNLFMTGFQSVAEELQRIFGEDDLISTGRACRVLGVCSKVLKVLTDEGHFTVYHHLKERRYSRGELLDYRNKYRINRKRG